MMETEEIWRCDSAGGVLRVTCLHTNMDVHVHSRTLRTSFRTGYQIPLPAVTLFALSPLRMLHPSLFTTRRRTAFYLQHTLLNMHKHI